VYTSDHGHEPDALSTIAYPDAVQSGFTLRILGLAMASADPHRSVVIARRGSRCDLL
jgi:hypothetical protein